MGRLRDGPALGSERGRCGDVVITGWKWQKSLGEALVETLIAGAMPPG